MKHSNRKILEMVVEIAKQSARSGAEPAVITAVIKNSYNTLSKINDKIDDKPTGGVV